MATPLVEDLPIDHRCPGLHRRRSHPTDGCDLLRNPQIVRVREPLFFPVRLPKDCQIHAGLVSCEVFSDIVPSHQLGLCSGEVDFAMEGVMGSRQLWGFVSVVLTQFVAMTMLVMGASGAGTTTVI